MILLDIMDVSDSIVVGSTMTFRFINNYVSIDKNHIFNTVNIHDFVEKTVKISKFLGEGSYGSVYKIKIDNKYYAIKLNKNELPNKLMDRYNSLINNKKFEKYVITMQCAGNILNNNTYKYYSIMEYGGKTLKTCIDNFDLDELINVVRQIYDLVHISSKYRILVTDLKLGNLTINNDNKIKLIDIYLYCESYTPCQQCKIIKTYSTLELDKEKHIYEDDEYNFSGIYIPFSICLIDLICMNTTSYYCDILSKKFDLNLNTKQLIPLLQISCYNYNNDSNKYIRNYKNVYKLKKSLEHDYECIKNNELYETFIELLTPKELYKSFINKKKLITIINDLINLDPNQRSLKYIKSKLM